MNPADFSKARTIQETTFLEDLDDSQSKKLASVLDELKSSTKATQVYRGVSRENLISKLTLENDAAILDEKLFTLLFYFGEKAKHYYEIEDPLAKSLRYLKCVEDLSPTSNEGIFNEILHSFNNCEAAKKFSKIAPDFFSFFQNSSNLEKFNTGIQRLGQISRDYYLYFLHTIGHDAFSKHSLLVSTSTNFDVASAAGNYVIYYIIPDPLEKYAIDPISLSIQKLEENLMNHELPTYNKKVNYPTEYEICVRSALFARSILGVKNNTEKTFIVNPHIFSNESGSIINGLSIDQSDFEDSLPETAYHRGVVLTLDGHYQTIEKNN
ncbi:MAG TPA: hypothetical protein PKJ84_10670 [Anaerolineales bacterium]|uniref:hypothetical protein n=1 Tax=Plasticicumulans sp. TaxID=2307179 RepID=UPI002C116772|nr:hypothetical protein [Plasticicumulans sp.]HMV29022.1 hypothetical protein [Anaerolineales bacterium]HNI22706.1 hypothetical protein [Plasticicumulans sp.]HNJ08253.1 hypothetical protein [Plasticicumulans sp.]HNM43747.1 hypothetical protein [Plasticicumulans sp.]HNO94627.1 hypothetical protein [Anaerolineales bacterium]